HIHTHVREDQLNLYGFASVEELELFEMLIQVDGVGPKVGLNILGAASLEVLKRAIMAEDPAPIRRASGVGQRTAAKVIIDLKPKLDASADLDVVPRAAAIAGDGAVPRAVESALRNLGFSSQEARSGLEAGRRRGEPVEHVLRCGPPGLGKTTLAHIIANELGVAIKVSSGPAIDHQGALGSILLNLTTRDVFFIDEIHRLNSVVEESLY